MSTTANLDALDSFQVRKGESTERFCSCFNGIVRNIEEEKRPACTMEQIRTLFHWHLEKFLSDDEAEELHKRVRSADKRRARHGQETLTREEIHQMALEADRDEVVNNVRLRTAGLDPRSET